MYNVMKIKATTYEPLWWSSGFRVAGWYQKGPEFDHSQATKTKI